MHVRVYLHETSLREWLWAIFFFLTKTGMVMAVPAVVTPTALNK